MSLSRRALQGAIILGFLLFWQVAKAEPVVLDDVERVPLKDALHWVEDPSGRLSVADIQQVSGWQRNGDTIFSRGYSDSAWWLRFDVRSSMDRRTVRFLELAYAVLDQVDVYVVGDGDVITAYHTGDQRAFDSRPLNSRYFVFPIDLQPRQELTVYLRIQTSSAVQAPLTLWRVDRYGDYSVNSSTIQGLYFGGMLVIIVYNLLIFLSLRDASYLYYVGFIASVPLFFAALSGFGFRYLWPDAIGWNAQVIPVALSGMVIFGALFTRRFLQLDQLSRSFDRFILFFALAGTATLVFSFFGSYKTSIMLLVPLCIVACLGDIAAGLFAWSRRMEVARFYVLAWACFLFGSVIFALNKLHWLPNNLFTEYVNQIGSILEAVLLSFAMAQRIQTERRLRFEAQEEILSAQRRLNEELELRVEARTAELEALNQVLQELSDTDPLTKLRNRRYLESAGGREWQQCLRYNHPLSLLLIDADHFKQVNDRHGHAAGDVCLQALAQQLMSCVRAPSDIVARYGGEEFCMVLPETDAAGAMALAERIRRLIATAPIQHEGTRIELTVSIGVSSLQPSPDETLEQLVRHADQALYQAKMEGRNRVALYDAETVAKPFE